MAGLGWTGSYGATGAAASLEDILRRQEMLKQQAFENQLKLRESSRQDMAQENQNLDATVAPRELYAPQTFIGDSAPELPRLQKYFSGTLRKVDPAPAMGPDFQGPSPTGATPEESQHGREGGYTTLPTSKQFDQMQDNEVKLRTAGAQKPMSQYSDAQTIRNLSNTWTRESQPTREMDGQVNVMHSGMDAARRGDLAQGAQVVAVTFQKILDPPSVVRESEYARSFDGQAFDARVKGYIEQLTKGGIGIPIGELEKYAQLAEEMANTRYGDYINGVRGRLERTADRYGIPHDLVFNDIQGGDPAAGGPPPPASAPPQMPGASSLSGPLAGASALPPGPAAPAAPAVTPPAPPAVRPRGGATPGSPAVRPPIQRPGTEQLRRGADAGTPPTIVTTPSGRRFEFPDQASADAFKRARGIP